MIPVLVEVERSIRNVVVRSMAGDLFLLKNECW